MAHCLIRRAKNASSKSCASTLNCGNALKRFSALSEAEEGAPRSADQIEARLVEEVRRLGSRAMHDWAQRAEERAARELRAAHPRVRLRKKKC